MDLAPVSILATFNASDAGKHPTLDAALALAEAVKVLPAPLVNARVSQLGGPSNAVAMVTIGLDPRHTWVNGIFENSRYGRFTIDPRDGTIEMFVSSKVGKFRKARFTTPEQAVAKIAKWLASHSVD